MKIRDNVSRDYLLSLANKDGAYGYVSAYEIINAPSVEIRGEWISVKKCGYPKPEDEYKHFLTIDNKGEITIQEFLLSLDEEPQPYFTGMRNIVAWMPLPEPYKAESEDKE